MRANPGIAGPNKVAQVLRKTLQPDSFSGIPVQWGVVESVHGGAAGVLEANAAAGATTISCSRSVASGAYVFVGSAKPALQVESYSGSGPFTLTLKQALPTAQAAGAWVVVCPTLDAYLDGASDLTYGLRWLQPYNPVAGDVVCVLRGQGNLNSDRLVLGPPANIMPQPPGIVAATGAEGVLVDDTTVTVLSFQPPTSGVSPGPSGFFVFRLSWGAYVASGGTCTATVGTYNGTDNYLTYCNATNGESNATQDMNNATVAFGILVGTVQTVKWYGSAASTPLTLTVTYSGEMYVVATLERII